MSILKVVKFCSALITMLIVCIPLCLFLLLVGMPTVVFLAVREWWAEVQESKTASVTVQSIPGRRIGRPWAIGAEGADYPAKECSVIP